MCSLRPWIPTPPSADRRCGRSGPRCSHSRSSRRDSPRDRRSRAPRAWPASRPSLARSAELDAQRRAVEAEAPPDLVLEVAHVREVHRGGTIHEEDERRRGCLRLRHVMEAYLATLVRRRRMGCDGLDEQLVEVRRRYAPPPLGRDRDRVGERLLHAAPGLRRDEAMAQPGREVELPRDLTLDRRGRLRTAVDERSEEHTSELQSLRHLVCRLLLEKKKKNNNQMIRQKLSRLLQQHPKP